MSLEKKMTNKKEKIIKITIRFSDIIQKILPELWREWSDYLGNIGDAATTAPEMEDKARHFLNYLEKKYGNKKI